MTESPIERSSMNTGAKTASTVPILSGMENSFHDAYNLHSRHETADV